MVIRILKNVRRLTRLATRLVIALPWLEVGAQTNTPPSARVMDSLPGLRLQWELAPVPGGHVTVPGADGPVRVSVEPFLIGVTEVPWELYDVFYLRLDVPREQRAGV
ncbi:MAG: hypothetical protein ABMA00_02765, partial [Gemmatimonas sp.]